MLHHVIIVTQITPVCNPFPDFVSGKQFLENADLIETIYGN